MSELAPFITTELKKFEDEISEKDLIALATKYKDLRITGVSDKDGRKAVYEARQVLKKKRVEITTKGKVIRASATAFQKAVIAREDQLVDIILPVEKILSSEEQRVDAEEEKLKKEEEEKESKRINSMIQRLSAVNYAVDFNQLKNLNDESFEELLKEATDDFNKAEEKRKAEESESLRLKKEEEERQEAIRKQREADLEKERTRVAEQQEAIRKQQEAIAEEQAKRDREFKAEQDRIKKEQEEREAKIKAEQAAKEKELAEREAELIRIEQEKLQQKKAEEAEKERLLKEESDRKAREEQAAKDEVERQNKINQEAEQKSKYFEDQQRFAFHAQQLEVNWIHSPVAHKMKSEKAKAIAYEVDFLIRKAYDMCKEHASTQKAVPVPEGFTND